MNRINGCPHMYFTMSPSHRRRRLLAGALLRYKLALASILIITLCTTTLVQSPYPQIQWRMCSTMCDSKLGTAKDTVIPKVKSQAKLLYIVRIILRVIFYSRTTNSLTPNMLCCSSIDSLQE